MKPFTGMAVLAVGWLFGEAATASAAWNNVFQTCCHSCQPQAHSAYFAPAPAACPTISYRQRCCYEPVVSYKQETYCEPVTTYRTSYFWQPVTTYRYTSYYDPCTGCCQQVATPCTSYRLRSQCNAVQSYVQRCRMVPVTSYRQSCYLEPVVTYSAPVCPDPCPPAAAAVAPPVAAPPMAAPPPGIQESPGGPARMPAISETDNRTLPPQALPGGTGLNRRRPAPAPVPARPLFRRDRTASLPSSGGTLQGKVVAEDRFTPLSNARLLFVSLKKQGPQETVTTDASGRFDVNLDSGEWLIYAPGRDGKPEYHSKISVQDRDARVVTVVSR